MPDKEQIYDEQIAPLMAEIIKICQANKIAMLFCASIDSAEKPDLVCTTALLEKEYDPPLVLQEALRIIMDPRAAVILTRLQTEEMNNAGRK